MSNRNQATVHRIGSDFPVSDLSNESWKRAETLVVSRYWNGKDAPAGRAFATRLLWSDVHLYVLFEAQQNEPLVAAADPVLTSKTMNLWDRDVCEIFLAPDHEEPRKYFEFEAAPTGEWLDVAIDASGGERICDWNYASGMETSADIKQGIVTIAIKLGWEAFGKKPKPGDVWRGNLLRCVGKDPDRGYLAWSPTMTDVPNFHVPERFGEFLFVR